jgi:hypothetical protein
MSSTFKNMLLVRHARNVRMVGDNEDRVYNVTHDESKTTPAIPLDAPTSALLTDGGSLFGPRAPLVTQETKPEASPPVAPVLPAYTQYKRADPPSAVFKFGNGTPVDFKFNTPVIHSFGFPSSTSAKIEFGDGKTKKWF